MKAEDYVRTKDGNILKIKDIEDIYTTDNEYIGMAIYDKDGHFVNDAKIIKSSSNIIDLIEVGDYVNYDDIMGGLVLDKRDDEITVLSILPNKLKNEDIKSVITKEQIENNLYKLED